MTMITIATLIALASGYVIGTGVTIAWEWDRLRKAHRRYRSQKWIPVSERLPSEKDGQNLVTKRGEVRMATYSEFSGTWYIGEMCAVGGEDPIAWMPLPEPYKGGDDE